MVITRTTLVPTTAGDDVGGVWEEGCGWLVVGGYGWLDVSTVDDGWGTTAKLFTWRDNYVWLLVAVWIGGWVDDRGWMDMNV